MTHPDLRGYRRPTTLLTREQRVALKRVYERINASDDPRLDGTYRPLTYREVRRSIQLTIGMDGAIAIPFAGMWLAIERDGYTHS